MNRIAFLLAISTSALLLQAVSAALPDKSKVAAAPVGATSTAPWAIEGLSVAGSLPPIASSLPVRTETLSVHGRI